MFLAGVILSADTNFYRINVICVENEQCWGRSLSIVDNIHVRYRYTECERFRDDRLENMPTIHQHLDLHATDGTT